MLISIVRNIISRHTPETQLLGIFAVAKIIFSVTLGLTISSPAQATFDVITDNWPPRSQQSQPKQKQQSAKIETQNPYATPNQKNIKYQLVDETNRFAARLGIGFASQAIGSFNKKKTSEDFGDFINSQINRDSTSLEAALGYKFAQFRGDIELIINKNFPYNETKDIFSSIAIDSSTKTQSLLVNGYYDFDSILYFKPYLSAGLGLAMLHTKAKFTGSALTSNDTSHTKNTEISPAFGFAAGARARFLDRFMLQINARMIRNGTLRFKNTSGTINIAAAHKSTSFGLSVIYII